MLTTQSYYNVEKEDEMLKLEPVLLKDVTISNEEAKANKNRQKGGPGSLLGACKVLGKDSARWLARRR